MSLGTLPSIGLKLAGLRNLQWLSTSGLTSKRRPSSKPSSAGNRWVGPGRPTRRRQRSNGHAGMHKHFRMLAIHDYMVSQGVVNANDEHTKIRGIWAKLASLYNLPILDEREDSIMNDLPDESGQLLDTYCPFS